MVPNMRNKKTHERSSKFSNSSETDDFYGRNRYRYNRELDPEFLLGETGTRSPPDRYIRTMCQVCNLQLFPRQEAPGYFPAAILPDNVQYMTVGGLSLCDRHYNIVNDLQEKHIPVDKWPSNLIRGIVKLTREYIRASNDAIVYAQRVIGETQTTRTVITPAPIFGNSYNPVTSFGGTGTFSDYFFMFPMQRQIVDQNAVNTIGASRDLIQTEQQKIAHYTEQLAKYSNLLERVRQMYPPKFKSCIRCGQSEIPLSATACTWCKKNQGFTGDVVPVPCLVDDVDPLNVIPAYDDAIGNLVSKVETKEQFSEKEKNNIAGNYKNIASSANDVKKTYCEKCDSEILNPKAIFCDTCGAKLKVSQNNASSQKPAVIQHLRQSDINEQPTSTKGEENAKSLKDVSFQEQALKFCPYCGKELPFGDLKYCPYCGKKARD